MVPSRQKTETKEYTYTPISETIERECYVEAEGKVN